MKVLNIYEDNGQTLTRMFLEDSEEVSLIMSVLLVLGFDCVPQKGDFTYADGQKRLEEEHIRSCKLLDKFNEATGGVYE